MKSFRLAAPAAIPLLAQTPAPPPETDQAAQPWWEFLLAWWFVPPLVGLVLPIWFVSISTGPERDPDRKPN